MHERIKLVSDTEVNIQRNIDHEAVSRYEICAGELIFNSPRCCVWDALGNEAAILVRQCWKDTGSFAALADTSAVPYKGKCMLTESEPGEVWVYERNDGSDCNPHLLWLERKPSTTLSTDADDLLPLTDPTPPPKKYRPYTAVEAAQYIGRLSLHLKTGQPFYWRGVYGQHVSDGITSHTYEALALDWHWDNKNETTCGMEVTEQNEAADKSITKDDV